MKFDALVAAKAAQLADEGDTSSLDIRRSKALGVIADQLMTGELDLTASDDQGDGAGAGFVARVSRPLASSRHLNHRNAPQPPTPRSSLAATLFVHVRIEDLIAHLGGEDRIGVVEKIGPATLGLLAEWLGDTDLRIRPVLDLNRTDAVDRHDPPEWMRELVIQRDRHCVFPLCDRDARSCDLDHTTPYVPIDDG